MPRIVQLRPDGCKRVDFAGGRWWSWPVRVPARLPSLELPVAAAVGAVGSFAVVVAWVLWGADTPDESKAFISTPQFVLWTLLLAAQAILWVFGLVASATIARRSIARLRTTDVRLRDTLQHFAVAAELLLVPGILTISQIGRKLGIPHAVGTSGFTIERMPLAHHNLKLPVIVMVGMLSGLVAIAAMWVVSLCFERTVANRPPNRRTIRRFVELRDDLNGLLMLTGAIVGLATLSAGALREAVLATNGEPLFRRSASVATCFTGDRHPTLDRRVAVRKNFDELVKVHPECELAFDSQYVLEYGLFFTGLLAIAYAPCFVAMRRAGRRLRDRAYPLLGTNDPKFFDRIDERAKLDSFLQTSLSANASFKAGVAILTPLAGSVVSLLLPG
jgi:hypothetical protein